MRVADRLGILGVLAAACSSGSASEARPKIFSCTSDARGDTANSEVASPIGPIGPASSAAAEDPPPVLVRSPPAPRAAADVEVPPPVAGRRHARAYQFNAPIYTAPDAKRIVGFARRGRELPVARWIAGSGCSGNWYELRPRGYVCSHLGFDASMPPAPLPESVRTRLPREQALPFSYAKVRDEGTPIWSKIPSKRDQERASAGASPRGLDDRSDGIVFVAIDSEHTRDDGVGFVRDVRGRWIDRSRLAFCPVPRMHGEPVETADALPLAFVHVDAATIFDEDGGDTVGTAFRFARFRVRRELVRDGRAFVATTHGLVAREDVRIARAVARPERVPQGRQWIHVDLDEQTLVAYEADRPVRATLVSSGKEGYEPPLGVFRVEKKYTARRMRGDDDVDGSYDIDQVPWTMYYWGSLALHGTYWHDTFGNVRSHGCTNIPPVDAHWLFRWADPALPPGWHGEVGLRGPYVVFSRGSAAPG
jgi:hypothetical protein